MKKSALVLTISGDTIEEIREKLSILAKQFGAVVETVAAAVAATPGKPGRKKKEDEVPISGNGVHTSVHTNGNGANGHVPQAPALNEDLFGSTEAAAAPVAAKAPTREDVQRAVVAVQTTKGLPTAREVIQKFGAKRFAELQEKDFAGVIQACHAALK